MESYKLNDCTKIAEKSHGPTFRGHLKKFKRKWKGKPKGNFKSKRACYKCGETGHFKANCPKNNGSNKQKEIAMTITESNDGRTNYKKKFFVDFQEKAVGEYKVYMSNNTYCDVLGEKKCKIFVNRTVIVLYNVYAPSICRNLVSVPIFDDKGYSIKFKLGKVYIRRGNISIKDTKIDNMYFLKVDNKISTSGYLIVSINSSFLWHLRLGHINKDK